MARAQTRAAIRTVQLQINLRGSGRTSIATSSISTLRTIHPVLFLVNKLCSPREGTNQTSVKDFLGKVPNIYYFTREIDNHDTYFALALIYNVCETQLQVSNSSIYSLVCSFVGRQHGDISIYLHHMMF